MRMIIKLRWLMLVLWIAAAAGLMMSAPNMEELVRDKGQITVPDGYSSSVANELLQSNKEVSNAKEGAEEEASAVLVFHRDGKLTEADQAEMKRGIEALKGSAEIGSVTNHFDTKELEDQLVSKDGTTVLALVNVKGEGRTPAEMRDVLYSKLDGIKVDHYYTGEWLINEDVIQSSQEGLKKTEFITVGFILVILLIVFRSIVAPLIPLLAVGLSYVVSQSVVAILVDQVNFPLSNFTQIFMVAVMFGIGTDYCILLISRYKEELAKTSDRTEAIINTYRTAGGTVLFSGLAVLVGFSSIGFSEFSLYRSAVAVAVGVGVLLLALITLVPFFMAVLGRALFWPAKGELKHGSSGLWGAMGSFSLKRPVWAIALMAVLIVPFLTAYKGAVSFNSLEEIGDKYDSVRAFNYIADGFGPGESMPSKVVVQAEQPLDTPEGLAAIEQVTRELAGVDGVDAVRSGTRPTGVPQEGFAVAEQADKLGQGLGEGGDAIGKIGAGLAEASASLSESEPKLQEAAAGAGELAKGTTALKAGVVQLGEGLARIERGLRDGSAGAKELSAGLRQAQASAKQLAAGAWKLLGSYEQLGGGLAQLARGYSASAADAAALADGIGGVGESLRGLAAKYPELAADAEFQRAQDAASQLGTDAGALSRGLAELKGSLTGVSGGLAQANAGLKQAAQGQAALAGGLSSIAAGIDKLQAGIASAAGGQGQIVDKLPSVTAGFDQLAAGQKELQNGFAQLNGQLGELTDGLAQSADGLKQVNGGLASAGTYLEGLSAGPNKQLTGWYAPAETLENAEFQQALDIYLSEDGKTATFDVVFQGNPYDVATLAKVDELNAAVERAVQGTPMEGAKYAVSGITSINNDLNTVSAGDYARTVMFMLIGIGLILMVRFRSIVIPIYILISLLLTYYSSLAIAEVIFVRILGYSGISWAVPFFGFVLLMALGVDYSIFLMDRFREYRHLEPREAILQAMKHMGGVIISAAVILGGTFAAMLPSGVMSLLQIATILLCGLFLYALVILPLFIPVMVRMFGPANWWPFMGDRADSSPANSSGSRSVDERPSLSH
ncbi:membrane protein [Paenibacillus swuensis]|uniref:Membrane protein n=1 Tax=Paenibacillus swuensis TaxID=1178515 RepID=A0A172THZ1_9BACL|nr:MMPL family transporter [Paenibacillus swuensis]ANE46582.1 membrane protein [Paenibacillus swuensis]